MKNMISKIDSLLLHLEGVFFFYYNKEKQKRKIFCQENGYYFYGCYFFSYFFLAIFGESSQSTKKQVKMKALITVVMCNEYEIQFYSDSKEFFIFPFFIFLKPHQPHLIISFNRMFVLFKLNLKRKHRRKGGEE